MFLILLLVLTSFTMLLSDVAAEHKLLTYEAAKPLLYNTSTTQAVELKA